MKSLWSRELASALLITGLGVAVLTYSQAHYKSGSFRSPGPGLFPALIAGLLAIVGIGLAAQAWLKRVRSEDMPFAARPFVVVLGSIAIFALTYEVAGVGPAVFIMTVLSSFGDSRLNLRDRGLLGLAVTAIAIVLFRVILGVQLPIVAGVW